METILAQAAAWKRQSPGPVFQNRLFGMVFFNPSLRTRTSFEAVMLRSGGHAIVLDVGNGVWKLEDRVGAVMNGGPGRAHQGSGAGAVALRGHARGARLLGRRR